MVYDLKKIIGPVPDESKADVTFDRLNVEGNGRLSLVNFAKEVNAFAIEKNAHAIDLKDFVYVVEWTGANCGGDGAVLIDRFVSTIRENQERRNMKNEFVTHYDSPQFMEGVQLLREEIKKCAKTPDGKFNFLIPFRQFDKDESGQIVLSEFEAAIRALGVDKYLSDQEIKSLMRRFDPNSSGALDYDEFLRFNLAESTSSSSRKLCIAPSMDPGVRRILDDIIVHERLSSINAVAFCGSLKRMFGIIDKETTGFVPSERFVQTLREMGITIPKADMELVVQAFAGEEDNADDVQYLHFCEMLLGIRAPEDDSQAMRSGPPATELLDLLMNLHSEYHDAKRKTESAGYAGFDFYRAFGIENDVKKSLFVSAEEFKEVLWAAGIRHPYLREELEAIITCFQVHQRSGFNVAMFCKFLQKGPSALFEGNSGSLDVFITRLQDQLKSYLSTGRDAEDRLFRLFSEFDDDCSGAISQDEFIKLLQMAGFRHFLSPDDEKLLLKFLDINGDGFIVYSEFLDFAKHADEKLNTVVASDHHSTSSPAPSPSKSAASPVRPAGSPSPGRDSSSRKRSAFSASSNKQSDPLAMLVVRIWKLNQKLHPEFPFEKYLKKYRVQGNEPQVRKRVFEKILDKFLAKLTESRVTFNMHEMDIDLLAQQYGSRDETTINYSFFLKDLANAQTRALAENGGRGSDSSSSSSGGDDELSCSSDDGEPRNEKKKQLALLGDAVKRARKSKSELELLRSELKAVAGEWEKKKRDKVSEHKIYRLLTKLAIRLRKKEVDSLLPSLVVDLDGRKVYDSKKFLDMLADAVGTTLGGGGNSNATGESDATGTGSMTAATSQAATDTPASLSAALAEKIYRCFLSAAQQNISGRKLLEKCDAKRTGSVTLLEFQTVLRLMGCTLTESEVEQVKKALGNDKNSCISYVALVHQISNHQRQNQEQHQEQLQKSAGVDAGKLQQLGGKGLQKQSQPPSMYIPSQAAATKPPSKAVAAHPMMPREEMVRVDSFLRPLFSDLLHTRSLSRHAVLQHFEAYDMKGTGFVSVDAFHSVMRKLDIWLPADVSPTVLTRFTSLSGDKFDYVDFCQVVCQQDPDVETAFPTTSRVSTARSSSSSSKLHESRAQPAPSRQDSGSKGGGRTMFHRKQSFAEQPVSYEVRSILRMLHACYLVPRALILPSPCFTLQRLSVSLPSLEAESSAKGDERRSSKLAASTATASKEASPAASGRWKCSVCYHTQSRPTPTCEICATQNPASVEYELLLQCSKCGFRNKPSASMCDLCSVPLHPATFSHESASASTTKTSAAALSIPQLELPLKASYDEGWIT